MVKRRGRNHLTLFLYQEIDILNHVDYKGVSFEGILHPSLTKKLSAIVFDIQFWLSDRIS
jgi:hypothetical protein